MEELDFGIGHNGGPVLKDKPKLIGHYEFKLLDPGGNLIREWELDNLVVNQGLNDLLNVYLNAGSQKTQWYVGLFQGNYAPSLTDTASNWAANATEASNYTSATRPVWTPAAASAQSITNSASPASFTFNADITLYGIALVSNNVIGGTGGTLFSEAAFAAPQIVTTGSQLLVTYTVGVSG